MRGQTAGAAPTWRPVFWGPAVGGLALAAALASVTHADPDLWGHVRFGLDIIADGGLTDVDPYSFTQDRPWVNHEWLSEVMMGVAWTGLGPAGLALLKSLLVTAGLWIIWSALRGADFTARVLIMGAAVVGAAPLFHTLRPQVWSFVGLALLCRALTSDSHRARWWLPGLFAVWANAHGGWLVGLGVLGAWAGARVWADRSDLVHWTAVCGASLAGTLLTPYGLSLWTFLLDTVRLSRPMIEEWQPLWAFGPERWLPWIAAVAAVGWTARSAPAGARWPPLLALGVLAYASLRVVRVYPLFVEATVVLLAPFVAARWPVQSTPPSGRVTWSERMAAVTITAVTLVASARLATSSLSCVRVTGDLMPEAAPVRALATAGPGRLVTYFDWGEYALWHLSPRLLVSMDGRRETVYSAARLAEHDAIVFGRPAGLAALGDWRPDYAWLPVWSVAARDWLRENGYRIDFESKRSFVAVREDLPRLDTTAPPASGAPRCFPG